MSVGKLVGKAAAVAAVVAGLAVTMSGVASAQGYSQQFCREGYKIAEYYLEVNDPHTAAAVFENLVTYGCDPHKYP